MRYELAEYISHIDEEKTVIQHNPTATDILNQGKISITKPDEIVDTPTPLAAGTAPLLGGTENKFFGIAFIVVIAVTIWYFLKRRK